MRFHVLAVPHTVSSKEYNWCAFTQKVVNFCKMMTERGHEVMHYGHEDSEVICTEHVSITTKKDLELYYKNEDWRIQVVSGRLDESLYNRFNLSAIQEINKRKRKKDIVLHFYGYGTKRVADFHKDLIHIEPGVGYQPSSSFTKWKVFESYALYHLSKSEKELTGGVTNWYEAVIPLYFDLDDFEYTPDLKEDYFLYLGRVTKNKGVSIAIEVAENLGLNLKIAGQVDGTVKIPDSVDFIGYADIETRKRLMARAKGLFYPSLYLEPFGAVQIESLLSGTPIITTDWGAFVENNIEGVTGFRCRTFEDFINAVLNINKIDYLICRKHGENYSLQNVAIKFEKYFQDILNLHTPTGWYTLKT